MIPSFLAACRRGRFVLLLSSLALQGGAAAAAGPAPKVATMRLGAWTLMPLQDATDAIPNDGKVFGVDVGADAVAGQLARAGLPTESIPLNINALVVRGGGRIMLFDTGLGDAGHGALVERMVKAGLQPASVTDIFLTHAHGDHAGGLLDAGHHLVFPKAVVHVSAAEWASMQAQGAQNAALVSVLRPRVRVFRAGGVILPGVRSIPLAGHTPGHVGYVIGVGGRTILDIGDLVHSSVISLAQPAWAMGFDQDRPAAARLRQTMLKQLAKSGNLVFAPHFPYPAIGRIGMKNGGFSWKPSLLP